MRTLAAALCVRRGGLLVQLCMHSSSSTKASCSEELASLLACTPCLEMLLGHTSDFVHLLLHSCTAGQLAHCTAARAKYHR